MKACTPSPVPSPYCQLYRPSPVAGYAATCTSGGRGKQAETQQIRNRCQEHYGWGQPGKSWGQPAAAGAREEGGISMTRVKSAQG